MIETLFASDLSYRCSSDLLNGVEDYYTAFLLGGVAQLSKLPIILCNAAISTHAEFGSL